MDYSLLLCITENPKWIEMKSYTSRASRIGKDSKIALELDFQENDKTRHTFLSKNCRFIYYIGIIDFLQDYHFEKRMENFLKESILGNSSKENGEISAVPPKRYAPRFVKFMAGSVIID
jgi:hypothetical protein